jgi:hypothetical protein
MITLLLVTPDKGPFNEFSSALAHILDIWNGPPGQNYFEQTPKKNLDKKTVALFYGHKLITNGR